MEFFEKINKIVFPNKVWEKLSKKYTTLEMKLPHEFTNKFPEKQKKIKELLEKYS